MTAYPDTSFLFAFYVKQSNSPAAAAHAATMKEPLHVTALLAYEFRQALRAQVGVQRDIFSQRLACDNACYSRLLFVKLRLL